MVKYIIYHNSSISLLHDRNRNFTNTPSDTNKIKLFMTCLYVIYSTGGHNDVVYENIFVDLIFLSYEFSWKRYITTSQWIFLFAVGGI